jgi:heme O synthase-like polyprenyltransferase
MAILTTWGRLLRLPNLFTVPGDIIVGMAIAGPAIRPGSLIAAIASVLCLYCAGLLLNDFFDRRIDARERPERPIPSGAAKASIVCTAGLALIAAGIISAWCGANAQAGIAALVIAGLVLAYDGGGKRIAWLGPPLMGLCRAGSVALGWAASGAACTPVLLTAAIAVWMYITVVTIIAARECEAGTPGKQVNLPAAVILAASLILLAMRGLNGGTITALYISLFAVYHALAGARTVLAGDRPVPPFIGHLLRNYIVMQMAGILFLWPAPDAAVIISVLTIGIFLRVAAEFASQRFYGS